MTFMDTLTIASKTCVVPCEWSSVQAVNDPYQDIDLIFV